MKKKVINMNLLSANGNYVREASLPICWKDKANLYIIEKKGKQDRWMYNMNGGHFSIRKIKKLIHDATLLTQGGG